MSLEDYFKKYASSPATPLGAMQGLGAYRHEPQMTETQAHIVTVCNEIRDMLIAKNQAYGNSFADPVGVFAGNMNPQEQLNVRIDDKLKRIKNGNPGIDHEDTVLDLVGYLILKLVLRRMA